MADERRPILTHLGRFSDGLVPLLEAAMPGSAFVRASGNGAATTGSEILVLLVDDQRGVEGIERALTPAVRWVHVLGAGVDGLDLAAIGDRLVTCSRGAAAPAIAEFVLAAMLAFEKRIPDSWIGSPPERWGAARLGTLRGRTAGIVGLGAIGNEVARRTLAFEMRVVGLRRTAAAPETPGIEIIGSLHELLGEADHVVIAAPATAATHHLLDAAAFAATKPGSHLVNVSRGSLVDQDALLAALDEGRPAMASLDVADPEPLPAGHPLYAHPRVRLTPHISWSSPDTMQRTIAVFADNVRRYHAGEPLRGLVDAAAGY
jgi:phosphoglycerate dehydrogenase-like enzyme